MRAAQQINAFIQSNPELRPALPAFDGGSGKRRTGPFYIDALLDHDAANNVDLCTMAAWYHDHAVRAAYGLSDTTTRMRATLQLEAYECILASGTAPTLAPSVLDNLLSVDHYIEVKIGSTTMNLNLHDAWSQFVKAVEVIDSDLATTTYLAQIARGGLVELAQPIFIDLETDSFALKSDAASALGVDERVLVVCHGALYPQEDGVRGWAPGTNAGEVAQFDPRTIAQMKAQARQQRAQQRSARRR